MRKGLSHRIHSGTAIIGLFLAADVFCQEADLKGKLIEVPYKTTADGLVISADIYSADVEKGPRPAIVWYHGGALMMGNRKAVPPQLVGLSREENYVLISMDYRLAPGAKLDEILADLKDGLAWVSDEAAESFGIDPNRILVAGASAGGYLANMSGILSDPPPKAIISYWGFAEIDGEWCNSPNKNYGAHLSSRTEEEMLGAVNPHVLTGTDQKNGVAQANLFMFLKNRGGWTKMSPGIDPATDGEELAPYCPIQHLTSTYPPILLLHGTKDKDVPYECSTSFAAALEKAGVSHDLITVEGGGHGLWGGDPEVIEAAFQRSLNYAREHLSDSVE